MARSESEMKNYKILDTVEFKDIISDTIKILMGKVSSSIFGYFPNDDVAKILGIGDSDITVTKESNTTYSIKTRIRFGNPTTVTYEDKDEGHKYKTYPYREDVPWSYSEDSPWINGFELPKKELTANVQNAFISGIEADKKLNTIQSVISWINTGTGKSFKTIIPTESILDELAILYDLNDLFSEIAIIDISPVGDILVIPFLETSKEQAWRKEVLELNRIINENIQRGERGFEINILEDGSFEVTKLVSHKRIEVINRKELTKLVYTEIFKND